MMLIREDVTAEDVAEVVVLVDEVQCLLAGIGEVIAAYDRQIDQADYPLRYMEPWPDDLSATALLVERQRLTFLRDALYRRYVRRLELSVTVAQHAARVTMATVMRSIRKASER